MKNRKQALMIGTVFGIVLFLVFVPGILMQRYDKTQIGKIQTEEVSAGRNALLKALSLEERIELYCSSGIAALMLFETGTSTDSASVSSDKAAKVSLEYSYQIEEKEVFEDFRTELERLVTENVLPQIIQPKDGIAISGVRFYLYSEETEYGAVFTCMEQVTKSGSMARFIVDEESGKIIAYYFSGGEVSKVMDSLQEYGTNYMDYLGLEYDLLELEKWCQAYKFGKNASIYYLYADSYEWMVYPTK